MLSAQQHCTFRERLLSLLASTGALLWLRLPWMAAKRASKQSATS